MGIVGGGNSQKPGLETPNSLFFFPELPFLPSPPPARLPSPPPAAWWPAANTGHTVRIQASHALLALYLFSWPSQHCSLATSPPPPTPIMNRVDLFRSGGRQRLGSSSPRLAGNGLGGPATASRLPGPQSCGPGPAQATARKKITAFAESWPGTGPQQSRVSASWPGATWRVQVRPLPRSLGTLTPFLRGKSGATA